MGLDKIILTPRQTSKVLRRHFDVTANNIHEYREITEKEHN
jgi:hypothetical protein